MRAIKLISNNPKNDVDELIWRMVEEFDNFMAFVFTSELRTVKTKHERQVVQFINSDNILRMAGAHSIYPVVIVEDEALLNGIDVHMIQQFLSGNNASLIMLESKTNELR